MLYVTLYADAEKLLEKERREYAIEKLAQKMRKVDDIQNRINHAQKELAKTNDDIADLCKHEVGTPPPNWMGRDPVRESHVTTI